MPMWQLMQAMWQLMSQPIVLFHNLVYLVIIQELRGGVMIDCKNVTKAFGKNTVLKSVSFAIPKGQIFGLLGPSGAGKTTLIKILTNQLKFEGGTVQILGKDVDKLNGADQKQIGIMMDRFGVYERFSCKDNLKIFADIYGIPHSRIMEVLRYVGLENDAKKPAGVLSKGMDARLRLARVLLHSPKVLFLDEPTSGLDPLSMRAIHKLILEKKAEGCTVLLTTHNMEEATTLCDTVALLHEGSIVEMGEPSKLCRKYNHQKTIQMHLTSGDEMTLDHSADAAERIYELLQSGAVETIHTSEPNLETVFLELTGRKLEEA